MDDCNGKVCVANRIRENHIAEYSKKEGFNLYRYVEKKEEMAFENSAWIRFVSNTTIKAGNHYTINPYTNLDILIRKLHDDKRQIIWNKLDTTIAVGELELLVKYTEPSISITIVNNSDNSFLINEMNFNSVFYLSNDKGEKLTVNLDSFKVTDNSGSNRSTDKTFYLAKGDEAQVNLRVPSIEKPLYFNFNYKDTRNIFPLY